MGPSLTSLSHMLVMAWDGPEPQLTGLIELFLLEISPKAEALPSRCHWKVPKSLLPYPLCPFGPTSDKSQDKDVTPRAWSAPPIPSLSVASAQGPWRAGEELMVDMGVISWKAWLKGAWFHQGQACVNWMEWEWKQRSPAKALQSSWGMLQWKLSLLRPQNLREWTQALDADRQDLSPGSATYCWVLWGKWLNTSELQLPHLKMGTLP